jgi:hypothetical protein
VAANQQNPTRKNRKSKESDQPTLAAISLRIARESSAKVRQVTGRHGQSYEVFRIASFIKDWESPGSK